MDYEIMKQKLKLGVQTGVIKEEKKDDVKRPLMKEYAPFLEVFKDDEEEKTVH